MKKKVFFSGLLFLIILLLAPFFFPRKSIPRNDTDLKFLRPAVSSNENAFFVLERAREEIYWPEGKETTDILDWKSWDPKLATEILQENQKALELIDQALRCPRFQVPEIQSFDEDFEYLGDWKNISRVALLRSVAQFREGKEKKAFDSTLRIIRFGHQIEDCGGEPIHYFVGSAVKFLALKAMRDMIANASIPCDPMQSCLHELDQLFVNGAGLINAIKLEYQLQTKSVEDMKTGKYSGVSNAAGRIAVGIFTKPFLDSEKTRGKFSQFARFELESIPQHYNSRPHNPVVTGTDASTFRQFFSGNMIGETLLDLSTSAPERLLSKKCRENVNISAAQTILALKCYKLRYGALPKALTDLVPEFTPAIPVDDFDGKPLRYSAERKIIYSVGADLLDSGGQETNSAGKSLDMPFKINF